MFSAAAEAVLAIEVDSASTGGRQRRAGDRPPVYRLRPLLGHLRLFGAAIRGRVEAALASFGV